MGLSSAELGWNLCWDLGELLMQGLALTPRCHLSPCCALEQSSLSS